MCFSAAASFATAGVLLPLGVRAIRKSREVGHGCTPLAAFPLLFGVQQSSEGFLWLALGGSETMDAHAVALVYLFFAYFLWPGFVALAAWRLEPEELRRRAYLVISVLGFTFGAVLYVPLLVNDGWLKVTLARHSILYEPTLLLDALQLPFTVSVSYASYALLVVVPLLTSSIRPVRVFGVIVLASVIVSALAFEYAFVSIWCFFAALLSLYIVYMMYRLPFDGERLAPDASAGRVHDRVGGRMR